MELMEALRKVPDPRGMQGRDYPLCSLLLLIILGKMCGETGLAGVHRLGRMLSVYQLKKLGFRKRMAPCHSTLTETMRVVDAAALQAVLAGIVVNGGEMGHVAIDGKTLRGSTSQETPATHCVSAFCVRLQGSVGQVASNGKGFEIPDAMRLLASLRLKDVMVTGDAMFCQDKLCQHIDQQGGYYLLPVKDNQPDLKDSINLVLNDSAIAKKNTSNRRKKPMAA